MPDVAAEVFARYADTVVGGVMLPRYLGEDEASAADMLLLQEAGYVRGVGGTLARKIVCNEQGKASLVFRNHAILLDAAPGAEILVEAIALLPPALEVYAKLETRSNISRVSALAERIKTQPVRMISIAEIEGERFFNNELFWRSGEGE